MTPTCLSRTRGASSGLELVAIIEIVERLQALIARKPKLGAEAQRFRQALGREIRGADHPDLAFADKLGEAAQRLLHGGLRIVLMGLVEIDVIGLQPPERSLDRLAHIGARQALLPLAHRHAELRRDDDLVAIAARLHPFADDRLQLATMVVRHPTRIDIGGVDEIEASIEKGIEKRE